MGWATCGEDSEGRPIGYAHAATCDHPGCAKKIDRGLAYACGGMHGDGNMYNGDYGCEKYFCGEHLRHGCVADAEEHVTQLCMSCADRVDRDNPEWSEL